MVPLPKKHNNNSNQYQNQFILPPLPLSLVHASQLPIYGYLPMVNLLSGVEKDSRLNLEMKLDIFFNEQNMDTDKTKILLPDNMKQIIQSIGIFMSVLLRYGRGLKVSTAAEQTKDYPEQPLILYSYEGNQFCRLVREVLCELDLPYELRNVGKKKSSRRMELATLNWWFYTMSLSD